MPRPDDLFDQAYAAEQIVAGVSDCQDELAVLVGATARLFDLNVAEGGDIAEAERLYSLLTKSDPRPIICSVFLPVSILMG